MIERNAYNVLPVRLASVIRCAGGGMHVAIVRRPIPRVLKNRLSYSPTCFWWFSKASLNDIVLS